MAAAQKGSDAWSYLVLEILVWLKNYGHKKLSSKAVHWKGYFIYDY
jgi:hypothetical protein